MKVKSLFLATLLLLTLSACAAGGNNTAEALPTVALDSGDTPDQTAAPAKVGGGGITASGTIVPLEEARMAFTLGGNVKVVNVKVGDQVTAGQVLVELENATLQIDLAQAERNLKELTSPVAIAAADLAVANAQKAMEEAQDDVDGLNYARASETRIDNLQAEIDLAKKSLTLAQDSYRQVSKLPDGDTKKASALYNMTEAQLRMNALVAEYNWITGRPSETDAAIIRANYDSAKAALQEAQWYAAALKGEQVPAEATGSRLAALESAQNAITAARTRLDQTRLVAPISGKVVVMELIAGEYAPPGQIILIVSDVSQFQVETTDLSERDVPRIAVGQSVSIFIEALGANATGQVVSISPVADTLGGDVVYKTTIDLDEQPEGALAGMSVEVSFE